MRGPRATRVASSHTSCSPRGVPVPGSHLDPAGSSRALKWSKFPPGCSGNAPQIGAGVFEGGDFDLWVFWVLRERAVFLSPLLLCHWPLPLLLPFLLFPVPPGFYFQPGCSLGKLSDCSQVKELEPWIWQSKRSIWTKSEISKGEERDPPSHQVPTHTPQEGLQ